MLAPPLAAHDEMARLEQLIGDAACTTDAQCRTVAVGALACGGPAQYLPWSTLRSTPAAVQEAAERYTRSQAASALHGGHASICRVIADPGARCQPATAEPAAAPGFGQCRLRTPGSSPTM
jgi:hypothetical protein